MNIIFFSLNMNEYKSANYQREFIKELGKLSNIFLYGPGFKNYNKNDDLNDIIIKSKFHKNIILFVGHSWLSDNPKKKYSDKINHNLNFKNSNYLKVIFLNKEYVNLDFKLKFIRENKFNLVFTHHHEVKKYEKLTSIKFFQIPFAFSEDIIKENDYKKEIDICFTGILQNQNKYSFQTDIRLKIMNKFFYSFFDIPIIKKSRYKHLNIYWNAIPRYKIGKIIKRLFFKSLNNEKYIEILKKSKISINSLSPIQLISPRYFESIACKCYVLCEQSELYENFFKDAELFQFKSDLSNFDKKLSEIFSKKSSNDLIKHNKFIENNSWKSRVVLVLSKIKKFND